MSKLISSKTLAECLFDVTAFDGFFDTVPVSESVGITWREFVAQTAPADGPAIFKEKERAPYIVPCALRDAPFIGKTLERAEREKRPSLIGKQRSAAHCMASAILKYDLDGMAEAQKVRVLEALKASALTFLAYSTWSYGLKSGVRVRVFIPLDRALEQAEYATAWMGEATVLFPELIDAAEKILDESAARIAQQQSVWCAAPEREHLAFRHSVIGGVASAEMLMAAAPKRTPTLAPVKTYASLTQTPNTARLIEAHAWLNPNEFAEWVKVGHCYKALAKMLSDETAYGLWLEYGARGTNTARNHAEYAPEIKWESFCPTLSADVALATLFGMARDGALEALELDRGKSALSELGRDAAKYLRENHRGLFAKLKGGTQ